MRDMKIKKMFVFCLTLLASAGFASAKGKSLSEIYSGSSIERKVDESRRNYAPSARENERVFGSGKTERGIKIGDILDIIIEEKNGYGIPKTPPTPKKETGVLL
tara:strand:+ start:123870 stop:124181 length:312 start_codon:yes stop_codon:yes gene_type:complete